MNTLYLQMETETLLNNAPLTRNSCRMIKRTFDIITAFDSPSINFSMGLSNYSLLHKNIYARSYFL